jgi:hypothetical protein
MATFDSSLSCCSYIFRDVVVCAVAVAVAVGVKMQCNNRVRCHST